MHDRDPTEGAHTDRLTFESAAAPITGLLTLQWTHILTTYTLNLFR